MRSNPEYYLKYRKNVETEMVALGELFHRDTPDSYAARDVSVPPADIPRRTNHWLTSETVCYKSNESQTSGQRGPSRENYSYKFPCGMQTSYVSLSSPLPSFSGSSVDTQSDQETDILKHWHSRM